jgi:hypothetical protein
MARTRFRGQLIGLVEVTPKLRTALPAEADRSPPHEEPVSLANRMIDKRARGFYLSREGGTIWI